MANNTEDTTIADDTFGDESDAKTEKTTSSEDVSWPELVAQLLHDKAVATSIQSGGQKVFHLIRLVNEAIANAAKSLPAQTDLMGYLLTDELVLPDKSPYEEETTMKETMYPPEMSESQRRKHKLAGRLFGPHGLVRLAIQMVTGANISVKRSEDKKEKGKKRSLVSADEEFHVVITATDTPDRAKIRIDCAMANIHRLWTIPENDGDFDEVKVRQMRLQKILSGKYDPESDDLGQEEDEVMKKKLEEKLGLPEKQGDEAVTLHASLPIPSDKMPIWTKKGQVSALDILRLKSGCKVDLGKESSDGTKLKIMAVDEPMRATLRLQKCLELAKKFTACGDASVDSSDPVMEALARREEQRRALKRIPALLQDTKISVPKGGKPESLMGTPPALRSPGYGGGLMGRGGYDFGQDVAGPMRNANNRNHRFNPMSSSSNMSYMTGDGMGFGGGLGGGLGDGANCKVFVYQLGPEATEVDVYDLFGKYGAINKVDIPRHKDDKSRGYAFVHFNNPDSAARAVASLDGFKFDKNNYKPLQVSFKTGGKNDRAKDQGFQPVTSSGPSFMGDGMMGGGLMDGGMMGGMMGGMDQMMDYGAPSGGEHKVFIYSIGNEATDLDIYSLCAPYGPVAHVDVPKDKTTNKGRGFAFVTFSDYASACNCIDSLDGFAYQKNNGRRLQVSFKSEKKA